MQKLCKNTQKLGSKSLRGHLARPDLATGSLRGHFGVTGLAQNSARGHFGATSGSPGSPRPRLGVTSGPLRGHLARRDLGSGSLRGHLGIIWLEKTRLEVTSGSLGSRKLGSKSLRGHLARENSARSHFDVTCLAKSLRSHLAREDSSRGHVEASKLCKKPFEKTVPVTPNSEALSSAPPRTEDGYPRVHTSIYILYVPRTVFLVGFHILMPITCNHLFGSKSHPPHP